jgi:pyrroloquinoline-quinone synthase
MDLIDRIDALVEEKHLLRHPFYQAWLDGTLPTENLQEYARQYYAFESTFPRVLSAIHARTEDRDARQAILENLWDEEHGEANHQELWLRFAEGVGVDRDDVRSAERNDATQRLVDTYLTAASEAPVGAAVAAVYAYEAQVPAVAGAKIGGLKSQYGIDDDRTLAFFEVHSTLDIEHSDAERQIVRTLGADDEEAVQSATTDALDAWWGFLDAVTPVGATV